jgi:hypothetical protein
MPLLSKRAVDERTEGFFFLEILALRSAEVRRVQIRNIDVGFGMLAAMDVKHILRCGM